MNKKFKLLLTPLSFIKTFKRPTNKCNISHLFESSFQVVYLLEWKFIDLDIKIM